MPSSKQIGATSDKPARSSGGLLISIVCLVVGYLGGSINSIDILKEKGNVVSSSVGQMVVMKNMTTNFTHSHAEGKILQLQDRIEELEDKLQMTQESATAAASADGTSNGEEDNDAQINNNAKSKNGIIEEIIPTQLLSRYTSDVCDPFKDEEHCKTVFPVSRNMLRQSRPIVGNTDRLHIYLNKLRNGTCTTALFIGGSVTEGHNGGGTKNAYPKHVMDIINARYPCHQGNGTLGIHEYRKTPASIGDSSSHFSHWSTISQQGNIDIVIIEFNVGDAFPKPLPHALEDKGNTPQYSNAWYFETILRRLLLLRQPDPVAIVTFNADYQDPQKNSGNVVAKKKQMRQTLFENNQEPLKLYISSMYEIPVFSVVTWLLPLATKKGVDQQYNASWPWSTKSWHSDTCCHPKRTGGHHVLALVFAYCLMAEEKVMLSYNKAIDMDVDGEHDYTMDDVPLLRDPLYLSPKEDELYVWDKSTTFMLDFTDPDGEEKWKKSIVGLGSTHNHNSTWSWYADNKDKDKFGLIADNVNGGQHIAISLVGAEHGMVEVSYVKSYENFGVAFVWLDDESSDKYVQRNGTFCNITSVANNPSTQQLDALWGYEMDRGTPSVGDIKKGFRSTTTVRVSLPTIDILEKRLEKDVHKYLHICLSPKNHIKKRGMSRPGPSNKFKLLSVRVY